MSKMNVSDRAKAMLAAVAPPKQAEEPKEQRIAPTDEQQRRYKYEVETVDTTHGQVSARAYRRQPLFETLALGKTGIDTDGLRALRYYRERHEETDVSLTRCCLDGEVRTGGVDPAQFGRIPAVIEAKRLLRFMEAAMGNLVDTMRAVALDDKSFTNVAIERFGSRKRSWSEMQKTRGWSRKGRRLPYVDTIVPKSSRYREIIRQEFLTALKRLTQAHMLLTSNQPAPAPSTGASERPIAEPLPPSLIIDRPPPPAIDHRYLDEETGLMRPWDQIAAIIRGDLPASEDAAA